MPDLGAAWASGCVLTRFLLQNTTNCLERAQKASVGEMRASHPPLRPFLPDRLPGTPSAGPTAGRVSAVSGLAGPAVERTLRVAPPDRLPRNSRSQRRAGHEVEGLALAAGQDQCRCDTGPTEHYGARARPGMNGGHGS